MQQKFTSEAELVDGGGKKGFTIDFSDSKGGGKTRFIILGVVCVCALACFIAGIVLISQSTKCEKTTPSASSGSSGKTSKDKEQCAFSKEAQRIGLEAFLNKVRDEYYKQHPQNTAWHPSAGTDKEKVRRDYASYDPTPAKIKERTDAANRLLAEIQKQKENSAILKAREFKALLQVKHYLKYMFGNPYDENYYAGDWMLGPNSFCWQAICGISYDINANIGQMKPRNYKEIEAVLKHLKDVNATIMQYISNMKLGIKTGMVRTRVECTGGIDAIKTRFEKVADSGPQGIFKSWYTKRILDATSFLKLLSKTDQDTWEKNKGKTVNQTIRDAVLNNIGVPLDKFMNYLKGEHYSHCRPDNVGPGGLAALPIDAIYTNLTKGQATTKVLPIKDSNGKYPKINGSLSYEMILGYFTTKDISADKVHKLGWKMVGELYPQAVDIAKRVTGVSNNETLAIENFQKILTNVSVSYFNTEEIPKNESSGDAFKLCKTVETAKKNCPNRWKAMENWFSFARMAMAKLDPKTVDMFYFTGDKHTTPNCPVLLRPNFNPSSGAQSYQSSGPQCSSNCAYNIPFFLKNLGPKFSEYSVNAHEARPGHHTQVQGNQEHFKDKCGGTVKWLDDQTYYTAFTEGWALYAENPLIAQQTDTYKTELMQKFGMLKWQIWRALRLVVDTGLHYKGFTRQRALDLFAKYAWDKSDIAQKEVLRYQSNPGQATAYMIGQLDIWRYRNETKKALGDKFSLKEFHFQALSQGSSPLSYLESHLKKFTACKKNPKNEGCSAILNPMKQAASSSKSSGSSSVKSPTSPAVEDEHRDEDGFHKFSHIHYF